MKEIILSISIALVFVILLVGVAIAWLRARVVPPADAMQQPPCGSTWRNQKSPTKCSDLAAASIPTVTFCDLLHNEERYKDKIIRTEAKLYGDSGDFGLGHSSCSGEGMGARVDFDSTYGIAAEAQESFDDFLCAPRLYHANKEAEVIVVGRVDSLDGRPGDRYHNFQFVIMCIQQAKNRLTYGGT